MVSILLQMDIVEKQPALQKWCRILALSSHKRHVILCHRIAGKSPLHKIKSDNPVREISGHFTIAASGQKRIHLVSCKKHIEEHCFLCLFSMRAQLDATDALM